jgi:hypothetical protein
MAKRAPKSTKPEHRFCTICIIEKPFADFRLHSGKPYNQCLDCENQKRRERDELNRKAVREVGRRSREKNRDQTNQRARERYANDSGFRERQQARGRANWRNPEYIEGVKRWREANRQRIRDLYKGYRENDPHFRLSSNLRNRIYGVIRSRGHRKSKHTQEMLGCSYAELIAHLESKFQPGMTWENYGREGWHVDHVIPLASAKTEEEIYRLNHYTNLQPLWAKDNLSKSDRLDWPPQRAS